MDDNNGTGGVIEKEAWQAMMDIQPGALLMCTTFTGGLEQYDVKGVSRCEEHQYPHMTLRLAGAQTLFPAPVIYHDGKLSGLQNGEQKSLWWITEVEILPPA